MKTPNVKLADWLQRTGMSRGELARRVRCKAREWDQPHIAPDTTGVRRWLNGESPRQPVPDILADVFSAQVGYRVTTYDLGFDGVSTTADASLVYNASFVSTVETVADLGRADVDRRSFLATAPFVAVAGIGPSRDWLLNTLEQKPRWVGHPRLEDVSAVRKVFGEFQKMDVLQGGGTARLLLAEYMNQHVFPLLRTTHTENVRRALCEAAAEQTYLLGWMAYDSGEHGTAQRYLIQSLRLAEEARNADLGGYVLAGMADQATSLGHADEGRRLAQAGRAGLSQSPSPACLSRLWCLEARALARLGEGKAATHAVVESEKAYDRVRHETEQEWAKFIDPAYLHGEHANTFRDLGLPENSEQHAQRSIEHAEQQKRPRRGAMSQAALAVSYVQRNDLEAAHAAGLRTLRLSKQAQSSRCTQAVEDLQRRMKLFGAHRLVADFNERAHDLSGAA